MSLSLEQKEAVVAQMSEVLADAQAAILADYRGLTVTQMNSLRTNARGAGVQMRVVKNTLARRAVQGTEFECLDDHLVGPLAFATSKDPVAVAKVLDGIAKEYGKLDIKIGVMSGKLLSVDDIAVLAKLPGREELLAMLLGTLQAPVQKLVRTLNEVPASFVRTLAAVRDSKQAA